ncbi:hypothetical protein C8R47DRAFT_1228779 [Mycena vitilis]|nr:hypothetical protein C8R47DRAFT_1228779 [Mycena vitilis]
MDQPPATFASLRCLLTVVDENKINEIDDDDDYSDDDDDDDDAYNYLSEDEQSDDDNDNDNDRLIPVHAEDEENIASTSLMCPPPLVAISPITQNNILAISAGVNAETANEYTSIGHEFANFCVQRRFVLQVDDVFILRPHKDTPWWEVAWLNELCDLVDSTGQPKSNFHPPAYSFARKRRSALTWMFGRCTGMGKSPWHEILDSYLRSLRRRLIDEGHTGSTFLPLTSHLLEFLYDEQVGAHKTLTPGWRRRVQLHAINTLCFHCMLTVDEALELHMSHLQPLLNQDNKRYGFRLDLKTRATIPSVGVKPYYIHRLDNHEAHLDVFLALCDWIIVLRDSRVTPGLVFRAITKNDGVTDKPLSTHKYLETLRDALHEVHVGPASFDRKRFVGSSGRLGGLEYWYKVKKKTIGEICEWAGWGKSFPARKIWSLIIRMDPAGNPDDDFMSSDDRCVCGRLDSSQ